MVDGDDSVDAAYSSSVEGSGWMGTDDSQRASNEEQHPTRTNRGDGLSALEAAFSPVAALAHDQPSRLTHPHLFTPMHATASSDWLCTASVPEVCRSA